MKNSEKYCLKLDEHRYIDLATTGMYYKNDVRNKIIDPVQGYKHLNQLKLKRKKLHAKETQNYDGIMNSMGLPNLKRNSKTKQKVIKMMSEYE